MDNNKYSPSYSQANEISYKTINYPNINTLSSIQNQNKQKLEKNTIDECQKLLYQLTNYRPSMNNKKDFFFDEDDIKNNKNFQIFLDNLLTKEKSVINLDKKYMGNEENSSIHSNKKFFLEKINNNINKNDVNNNNKKEEEEDKYYSFVGNKSKNKIIIKTNNDYIDYFPFQYKLKNFINSIPKKSRKQIIINNKDYSSTNNDLEYNKKYLDSTKNILQSLTEKKTIGVDCKMNDYFLNKHKKRNNNTNDNLTKLTQTFSFKQFDGQMLNKLINLGKLEKKVNKNKNNSFNHIKKYIPEYKIPKIIFYSRNNDTKDKKTEYKLNTMKENVIHFLKDNNLTSKNIYNSNIKDLNINNNNSHNNNNFYKKEIFNPIEKKKLIYGNERNLIPYLKTFEKSYKIKMKKKKLSISNKKSIFSNLKNKNKNKNISKINIKSVTVNNK